ncbi:hypothetical protein Bhyg_10777 [Pseudolycoriella hygida]|nr:hypothetical protein Bhyg_10777 [Pseudolycoriella hygida]
MDNYNN